MRRLLVVSYCFPPILTAEAILVAQTLRGLQECGWDATVLTVAEQTARGLRDPSLSELLPASVQVVTAPTFERPFTILRRAPFRVLLQLGLPEEQSMWFPAAAGVARRLARGGAFSAMLSWSSYPTSNVVGLAAKAASGLPWVAHFSDPWIDGLYAPRRPLQRRVCARLEQAVIRESDGLTFTTRRTAELVMQKYPPTWRAKVRVIPHGYMSVAEVSAAASRPRPLQLVHAGSFYKGKRTPLPLFEALSRLDHERPVSGRLRLVLVGPLVPEYVRAAQSLGLRDVVEFIGPRPFNEARSIVAQADVPVVIEAHSTEGSVFLPSKLVDALAIRRPILGITPLKGEAADLLRRLGCPVAPPDDIGAIAAVLKTLIDQHERGELRVDEHFVAVAEEYRVERTSARLAELLDHVSAREGALSS